MSKTMAYHLEGRMALSEYLQKTIESNKSIEDKKTRVVCIFDFDRTLTNGVSFVPSAPLDERVRGGKPTLDALKNMKKAGASFYIVTARSPREMVMKQIQESFKKAQKELAELFDLSGNIEIVKLQDIKLARGGDVYACGYQKAAGAAHCLMREDQLAGNRSDPLQVHFFDDAITNAGLVINTLRSQLKTNGASDIESRLSLNVCWWDPFREEVGKKPTMNPLHSSSSDFNYHDYYQNDLSVYGIDPKERKRRLDIYLADEKAKGRSGPPPAVEKPKPKKLGNLDGKHAGLANLFANKTV